MKILAGIFAACFLGFLATFIKGEGVGALLFGWIPFLARVVSAMEVDWPNLWLGVGAAILLGIGIQWLGWSWRRPQPWKARWTIMLVVTVVVLFAAGLSLIGIFHQASWLMTSEQPLVDKVLDSYGNSAFKLGQIGGGMMSVGAVYKKLPPVLAQNFSSDGTMLHSWETELLPFMELSTRGIDMNRPWYDPCNQKYFKCIVPQFINTDLRTPQLENDQGYGLSHYAANEHVIAANKSMSLTEIIDGTANTLLVGEINASFVPWGHPVNWRDPAIGINRSPLGFGGSPGSGGALFINADGSLRFVSDRISSNVLRALSTPCGNEKSIE